MATSPHFKDVTKTLAIACGNAGVTLDVYSLLNLSEALIDMGFDANDRAPEQSEHDMLVEAAMGCHEAVASYNDGKKILAIKAVRALTGAGLKAAKDAVEDDRFGIHCNLIADPWGQHHDRDEPPF